MLVVIGALMSEGPGYLRLAIAIAAAGLGTLVTLKWMRSGVYVDAEGVEVRGVTNKRVHWTEISRFELRDGLSGVVAHVVRLDGSSIRVSALNAGSGVLPSMVTRAQEQVDALNDLLIKKRGHVPPAPPQPVGPKRLWEYPGFVIAIQGPLAGLLVAAIEPSVRSPMIVYAAASFVGGLGWLWKQKGDESHTSPKESTQNGDDA